MRGCVQYSLVFDLLVRYACEITFREVHFDTDKLSEFDAFDVGVSILECKYLCNRRLFSPRNVKSPTAI